MKIPGLDPTAIREQLRREIGLGQDATTEITVLSPRLVAILETVDRQASSEGMLAEHALLRAIIEEGESLPARLLRTSGKAPEKLLAALARVVEGDNPDATRLAGIGVNSSNRQIAEILPNRVPKVEGKHAPIATPGPSITPVAHVPVTLPTPTLDQQGRDLTKLARLGKLGDAIGREAEIDQIITILARTHRSPIIFRRPSKR